MAISLELPRGLQMPSGLSLPGLRAFSWRFQFWSRYGRVAADVEAMKRLRLLLGAPGSGAEWLARALVHLDKSSPCFNSPTMRIDPPLVEADRRWVVSMDYRKELRGSHPLEYLLRHLAAPKGELLARAGLPPQEGEGAELRRILVTESNGMLMAESLVRTYRFPMILMVTDPVYCVDRLQAAEGNTEYLMAEFNAIRDHGFLRHYFKEDARPIRKVHRKIRQIEDPVERSLFARVLTLAVIHRMFRHLASRHRLLECLSLGDLLHDPGRLRRLAESYCNKADRKTLSALYTFDYGLDSQILVPDLSRRPLFLDAAGVGQAYHWLALAGLDEPQRLLSSGGKRPA